jgi:hypothetical protein
MLKMMIMMKTPMVSWRFFLSLAAMASLLELVLILFHTSQIHQDALAELVGMQPWMTENSDLESIQSSRLMTQQRRRDRSFIETTESKEQYYKPRILLGILADSQTKESKEMRNRFRQMFQRWSDSRVCSLNEFLAKDWVDSSSYMEVNDVDRSYDCQIVYSFVLGAYSRSNVVPNEVRNTSTVKLFETPTDPLVLKEAPTFAHSDVTKLPYSDVLVHKDGIFLNIVENMNEGKTETFLYWASKVSNQFKIPYIAKCDTDTVIRLQKMLRFLNQELPLSPVMVNDAEARPQSIVAGAMRHKPWKGGFLPTVDESFWQQHYFHGMHLYLNGGFYLMSRHLGELAVREARHLEHIIPNIKMDLPNGQYNDPHSYLEGAEDHDAVALAEQGLFKSPEYQFSLIQWLIIPKNLRFFSHPVKSREKWERFFSMEKEKMKNSSDTDVISGSSIDIENDDVKTLLVIFNATTVSMREDYRSELQGQDNHACNALHQHMSNIPCDIYYLFVVGNTSSGVQGEKSSLRNKDPSEASKVEKDVLFLNVDNEDPLGLGLAAVNYAQTNVKSGQNIREFAWTIFCQSTHIVNVTSWNKTVVSQLETSLKAQGNHHFLIGDVRDKMKNRNEREYQEFCDYEFFRSHHDAIQLYLASDCFAFSSNLVPILLRGALNANYENCRVGKMGHDLPYLAYKRSDVILHWMPVPQSRQFWYRVEIAPPAWEPDLLLANSGIANTPGLVNLTPELPSAEIQQKITSGAKIEDPVLFYKPRVLVGIVTDSITFDSQTLRNRHRQLFNFWNDPRLCSLNEFRSRTWEQKSFFTSGWKTDLAYDCQVVYSFILAAHHGNGNSSSFQNNATTLKLYDTPEQPLVLKTLAHSSSINTDNFPFADVLDNGDGTFLNIIENMNRGKTATFLSWASEMSKLWNIPYVAKCDSDSFLNLTAFLNFLHQDLPMVPMTTGDGYDLFKQPSVFAGSPMLRKQRDRDWWLSSTDDSFWENEYFLGSHLYYNGGFYLMSRDLAESSTSESRRLEHHVRRIVNHETRRKKNMNLWEDQPHEYLEGTEDVDAFGTAEYGHYRLRMDSPYDAPSVIQWMNIPHQSVFHVHPVKVKNRLKWKALWARENRFMKEKSLTLRSNFTFDSESAGPSTVNTLIIVYGASTHSDREKYRAGLFEQGKRVCKGLETRAGSISDSECNIHYLFIVGRDDEEVNTPRENIHDIATLVWSDSTTAKTEENGDVLFLNVQERNVEGVGLSALFYIQEKLQGSAREDRYDLILFAKASHMVNIEKWENNIVSTAQYSLRNGRQIHLLIGDVRDKGKNRREFISTICDNPLGAFKYHKHHSPHQMQLYLGSDCFALSSNVVNFWLEQAKNPNVGRCTEGHLGHDLTYLSHFSGARLHWMRVPKSLQFWSQH